MGWTVLFGVQVVTAILLAVIYFGSVDPPQKGREEK